MTITDARRRALQVLVDHGSARISNETGPPNGFRHKGPRVYWQTAGALRFDRLVCSTDTRGEIILTASGHAYASEHGIVPS